MKPAGGRRRERAPGGYATPCPRTVGDRAGGAKQRLEPGRSRTPPGEGGRESLAESNYEC